MKKFLTTGAAVALLAATGIASAGGHSVCETPSTLGDLGNFEGETITIMGSMEGQDEVMLNNTVSCFAEATGAVVKYSGSRDFAALIVADLRSNNAPNIAILPQPGLAGDMAKEGHLVPMPTAMTTSMALPTRWISSHWSGTHQSSSKTTVTKFQRLWKG